MGWAKWGDFEVNLHYIGPMYMKDSKGVEKACLYKYNLRIRHKDLEKMQWTILIGADEGPGVKYTIKNKEISKDMMKAVIQIMNELHTETFSGEGLPLLETALKNISKKIGNK